MDKIFKFELFFPDYTEFGDNGLVEITEPVKVDALSLSFTQDKERMGRDVISGADEISLEFHSGEYDRGQSIQMPDGRVTDGMTMGYELIAEVLKRDGSEGNIELRISQGANVWSVGQLDLKNANHDGYSCIKCKIVNNQARALLSRNLDTEIDILSDKGVFDQPSAPVELYKMWYKPRPIRQVSTWEMKERIVDFAGGFQYKTYARVSKEYGIRSSLVPPAYRSGFESAVNDLKYIRFFDDAKDIEVNVETDIDFIYRSSGSSASQGKAFISLQWYLFEEPFDGTWIDSGEVYYKEIEGADPVNFHLPENITFTVPNAPRGTCLTIFWQRGWETENLTATTGMNDFVQGLSYVLTLAVPNMEVFGAISLISGLSENEVNQGPTFWDIRKNNVKISATTTGIPSVMSVARWLDVFKKQADAINGFPVESSILGKGGEFYDVFITDGNRMKQRSEFPFVVKWKDNANQLNMIRADYQVNKDRIIIEPEPKFYQPVEIGAYTSDPDIDYAETFAEKNTVVRFEPKYDNYEQDDNESNTIEAICTEAQYHTGNKNAINVKAFSLSFTADVYAANKIQQANLEVKKNTSTTSDDKKYIFDCVALPPGTQYPLTKRVAQRSVPDTPGQIEILNNDIETNGIPINWLQIGLGNTFQITGGANAGTYTIVELEESVITANRVGAGTITDQNTIITILYTITGVQYQIRFDEGFTLIEGVERPNEYGNIRFSIRSIAQRWLPRLSCYGFWSKTGKAKKMYYKNNPTLISQFGDEPVLNHAEDIQYITPTVTPRHISRKISPDFAEALRLTNAISEQAGCVRVSDPNGRLHRVFLDDENYIISEEIATITGECAYDPEILAITTERSMVRINQFGYESKIIGSIDYQNNGNFVRLLDVDSIPLTGIYRYDKVTFNGISFNDPTEMAAALQQLVL